MSDAILIVSFGGPEDPAEVLPFLENVTRGRRVPRERLLEVAEHYHHFGGKSPINGQCRVLRAALEQLLARDGPPLSVYWGNRNWHPFLEDTVRQMAADGIRRASAFVTSAFGSYSGCLQYRQDIERARAAAGEGAPEILKLRLYYNHPGFINTMTDRAAEALGAIPSRRRPGCALVFTAHSIPEVAAAVSPYAAQLTEACRLVAGGVNRTDWRLVYQSRSGPPDQPWLGPDILEHLEALAAGGATRDVVVVPIGFVSDHMEVIYDLDTEARARAAERGLNMVRAGTAATDPRFVEMIRSLVLERLRPDAGRLALGAHGPRPDTCPAGCCAAGRAAGS